MIAYLDLPSGISGDMLLGCLIDAGWPAERLRRTIDLLDLPAGHWAVEIRSVQKGSLRATSVEVLVEEGQHRRGLSEIERIIRGAALPDAMKEKSIAVFTRLAEAEAKVHGTAIEDVHFHEVGALDAIVDIVGSVAGLHELGIEQLYASALPIGSGWAQAQHGRLPLPAPATLELLSAASAPIAPAPGLGELVTPTGAAIVATLARFSQPPMTLRRIGTGAGRKEFAWPNIARIWLGDAVASEPSTTLVQLDTNIDDMNPQFYPAVIDRLLAAGALDAWLTPIQMKKGRPAILLSVLALECDEAALADLLLRETTTLGVRVRGITRRHEADREFAQIQTPYGTVRGKAKRLGDEIISVMPEYEDCRERAVAAGVPVRVVHDAASAAGAVIQKSGGGGAMGSESRL